MNQDYSSVSCVCPGEIYDALPERITKVEKTVEGTNTIVVAPKTEWINEIARITKSSPKTVQAWLYGVQKPDALKLSIISEFLKVPEEGLFN